MDKHTNETRLLTPVIWKNSLASFGKLVLFVLLCAIFLAGAIFCVEPNLSYKISNFFGLEASKEASLIRAYEIDGETSSLYNLVVYEQGVGNFERELYYINLLQAKEDYDGFCEKLDNSSSSIISENKSLVAYLCNTKSYMINQKIICMWNLGTSTTTIGTYICSQLLDSDSLEYGITTYIEYVYNCSLSSEEKLTAINNLLEISTVVSGGLKTVQDLLDERIESLESKTLESGSIDEILTNHVLMNLWKGKYYASLLGAYDGEYDEILNSYSAARQNYYRVLV